jgi:hypothetical protein
MSKRLVWGDVMNALVHTAPVGVVGPSAPGHVALYRHRETATAAMIRQIDDKIYRLSAARRDRAAALNRIRCELARATTEPAAPDSHEHQP